MNRIRSGSAVPRYLIFILEDGAAVVQWDETHVQELLTGRYRTYTEAQFGHHVSDHELAQLKAGGRVEHFNRTYVWLYALPEQKRFMPPLRVQEHSLVEHVRRYYVNTTLPTTDLEQVRALLESNGLSDTLKAAERTGMVVVISRSDSAFYDLKDAEAAQRRLQALAPDLFRYAAIAFVDTPARSGTGEPVTHQTSEILSLDLIIASQTDTTLTKGKRVVVASRDLREYEPVERLLSDMKMTTRLATTAPDTLALVEDFAPNLLLMDLQLPEMHGWQLLAKLRELGTMRHLLHIVVAESGALSDDRSFGLGIAKVDAYLVKPLSMARLRHNIWLAFQRQSDELDPA